MLPDRDSGFRDSPTKCTPKNQPQCYTPLPPPLEAVEEGLFRIGAPAGVAQEDFREHLAHELRHVVPRLAVAVKDAIEVGGDGNFDFMCPPFHIPEAAFVCFQQFCGETTTFPTKNRP